VRASGRRQGRPRVLSEVSDPGAGLIHTGVFHARRIARRRRASRRVAPSLEHDAATGEVLRILRGHGKREARSVVFHATTGRAVATRSLTTRTGSSPPGRSTAVCLRVLRGPHRADRVPRVSEPGAATRLASGGIRRDGAPSVETFATRHEESRSCARTPTASTVSISGRTDACLAADKPPRQPGRGSPWRQPLWHGGARKERTPRAARAREEELLPDRVRRASAGERDAGAGRARRGDPGSASSLRPDARRQYQRRFAWAGRPETRGAGPGCVASGALLQAKAACELEFPSNGYFQNTLGRRAVPLRGATAERARGRSSVRRD
jgi:hypothetical protein